MSIVATPVTFSGQPALRISNEALTLWLTTAVGPRILGLAASGGENLFAVLPPSNAYRTPAGRTYTFRGGHRLWHAPEHPERTYVPDDAPLAISATADGTTVTQPVEDVTSIDKQLTVALAPQAPQVTVTHRLTNRGNRPVTLAPWAITQLRPGGVGILPLPTADTGLLPNRRLALWPYTRVTSPHLRWDDRFLLVSAAMRAERFKIGWTNPAGWLAYLIDDLLFVKHAPYEPGGEYVDFSSNSECYCDDHFLELETLGPLVSLAPGEATEHVETWQVHSGVGAAADPAAFGALVVRLGLARD